jgi:hypothetical protein
MNHKITLVAELTAYLLCDDSVMDDMSVGWGVIRLSICNLLFYSRWFLYHPHSSPNAVNIRTLGY